MNIHLIENTPMKLLLDPIYFTRLDNTQVKIPAGYAFDGLSIPRPLQWLVNMNLNSNSQAGLIHDYMYSTLSDFTKNEADTVLYHLILKNNPRYRAILVYLGVWAFGGFAYRKDGNYMSYRKQIMKARGANKLPKNLIKKKKL